MDPMLTDAAHCAFNNLASAAARTPAGLRTAIAECEDEIRAWTEAAQDWEARAAAGGLTDRRIVVTVDDCLRKAAERWEIVADEKRYLATYQQALDTLTA